VSVRIRLTRVGRKKIPHYRIVVMDSRNRRDGAYLDQIGVYHPRHQPAQVSIDEKKALNWLSKGAVPSDTVHNLLSRQGILLQFDMIKRQTSPDVIAEALSKWKSANADREVRRAGAKKSKRKSGAATSDTPADAPTSA